MSSTRSLFPVAKVSDCTKCIPLNNEPPMTRSTFIDLNQEKLHYYPLMISHTTLHWMKWKL